MNKEKVMFSLLSEKSFLVYSTNLIVRAGTGLLTSFSFEHDNSVEIIIEIKTNPIAFVFMELIFELDI